MTQITLPFAYDAAQHRPELATIATITLSQRHAPVARNQEQRRALLASGASFADSLPGSNPLAEQGAWYDLEPVAQRFTAINGETIFREKLFLFNVIISTEWQPSGRTLQELRVAAQRMSNFLYDVTDGYMAFGQVLIGGPELLDAADIQVLASNRLHPRAWNDALQKPQKFQPIRVGRGLWQKNRDLLFAWSTPEGYRTLTHEWGHYAFGMGDRYLEKRRLNRRDQDQRLWDDAAANGHSGVAVPVPRIALPVETVMANQEISEYAPVDTPFERISERFGEQIAREAILEGPEQLPLPLPIFPTSNAPARAAQDVMLALQPMFDMLNVRPTKLHGDETVVDGSYWLYVLKYEQGSEGNSAPVRIIAQGKLSGKDKAQGTRLLGADEGDQVVVVSELGGRVRVLGGALHNRAVEHWDDLTPGHNNSSLLEDTFFVDVVPASLQEADPGATPRIVDVAVSVTASSQPDEVLIYRYGPGPLVDLNWQSAQKTGAASKTSAFTKVAHLDGHVLLRWQGAGGVLAKMFIASYSQGGGPASIGGKPSISGGSAEGNAMLFFLGPDVWGADKDNDLPPDDNSRVRIVTTVLPARGPYSVDGKRVHGDDNEARSYVFSLASNAPLDKYAATLVLYYDNGAPKYGGDLLIHRWDSRASTWRRLTTIMPSDLAYVAVPITAATPETAPSFMDDSEWRIERFRILWKQASVH